MLNWIKKLSESDLLRNSFWGIFSNIIQNVFVAIFFVIIARKFSTGEFGQYLVANGLYLLFAALSNLGLNQWFIRELMHVESKKDAVNHFFKIQLWFGLFFFIANLVFAYLMYDSKMIHILALIFGFNIIFDNIIYAIRALNVAESEQKKSFIVLIIESILRLLVACLLFIYPFSVITFSLILIIIRLITLNLFLRIGSSNLLDVKSVLKFKVYAKDVKQLVFSNWSFVIIGSVVLLYWRSSSIIISKMLTLTDVAIYEIGYKIFAIAQIVPGIISTTVFPKMVKIYKEENLQKLHEFYRSVFFYYFLYGLLSYTFIYAFGDMLLPWIFGENYQETGVYTKEMFLTMLVFPTALLQANLLVAIKLEKLDMFFNVVSLFMHLLLSIIGLLLIKSLSVINFSIFISFIIFHLLQDIWLVKKGVTNTGQVIQFYVIGAGSVVVYLLLANYIELSILLFCLYWFIILAAFFILTSNGRTLAKQAMAIIKR